ncbi:prolyl oligopeptidase family serine peptidase [Chitinophaga sp. CB10]|uniref:alpha/beta hydrolase family protein n=1 Tax=Chitinophaga sp. CB10 TaxID=1891659 RepID=UPI0025BE025A|nr:prolyl oligopeptidase family serine peptidase [Chitinophaga sp. CB10]
MKKSAISWAFIFCFLLHGLFMQAQEKPPITTSDFTNWTALNPSLTKLSYSGKYFAYQITNEIPGCITTYFESIDKKWKKKLYNVNSFTLTSIRNKEIGIALKNDSLWLLNLGSNKDTLITNVESISTSTPTDHAGESSSVLKNKWIIISKKDNSTDLINTEKGDILHFDSVRQSVFLDDSETPILRSGDLLLKINQSLAIDTIYKFLSPADAMHQIVYSTATQKLYILITEKKNNKIVQINDTNKVLISEEYLQGNLKFSVTPFPLRLVDNDSTLLFNISPEVNIKKKSDTQGTSLVLWTYMDNAISTKEKTEKKRTLKIMCTFNLFTGKFKTIENDSMANLWNIPSGEWIIIGNRDQMEDRLNPTRQKSTTPIQAVSVKEKGSFPINIGISNIYSISPLNNYIMHMVDSNISIYSLENKKSHSILRLNSNPPTQTNEPSIVQIAGWSNNNDTVYFYYNYDVYMASCKNQFQTINLTSGYGAKNKIQFFLRTGFFEKEINFTDLKYLLAIDKKNMEQGFYFITPGKQSMPQKLEFGPRYYVDTYQISILGVQSIHIPIKARGSETYLITRSSISESPNIFLTKDFKKLIQLTNVNPESKFNWMQNKLIQYQLPNGIKVNGVLYRPENFDSTKKYPLIILSYEDVSQTINGYIAPQYLCNDCMPNIPSYVSNGYLVFAPDVYRPMGDAYMGPTQTIASALETLSKMKEIDMERIGIAGCSYSGHTTDFILTQIKAFKAAVVSSAISNPISGYNMLVRNGPKNSAYVSGQSRFGVGLYDDPQRYINNNALLKADKIQTPLLLMHTTNDATCPFYDALEFFTALRNLNKKVWLLEYQKGSHGVSGNDIPDFSRRMREFFDHYLKQKPAPLWMTEKTDDPWNEIKNKLTVHLVN